MYIVSRKQLYSKRGGPPLKAAVLHTFGSIPRFEDFPEPTIANGELSVRVLAVVLENIDKALASGTHFAARHLMPALPAILGFGGIGALEDGEVVGFGGMKPPYGAMAEKAVIPAGSFTPIPDGIDPVKAAAIPASALTSLLPLLGAAGLKAGESVFIHGATGVSGMLAVQIAKLLGAGRIVGTGRDETSLHAVLSLGADAVIDLKQDDQSLEEAFFGEAREGLDIILDFVWGHPTEVLLKALIPRELGFAKRKVRMIQIGEVAGPTIALPAAALRTSGLEIYGAGTGITSEALSAATKRVWEWMAHDKLRMEIEPVPLKEVEQAWRRTDLHGKRLVIVP